MHNLSFSCNSLAWQGIRASWRLLVRCPINSIFRVCGTSHTEAGNSYLPQFEVSDNTPWDRAVEFGEGQGKCSVDVLGKSRVLKLAFNCRKHWDPISNLVLRTRSSAEVFYGAVKELDSHKLKTIPRPNVQDYACTYAMLSVWSGSFQVADELALDSEMCRDVLRGLSLKVQECPRALEEALFEVYFSLSQGKVRTTPRRYVC